MFTIKTIVEKEMLEHVRKVMTIKEVWDTFMTLFLKAKYMATNIRERTNVDHARRHGNQPIL